MRFRFIKQGAIVGTVVLALSGSAPLIVSAQSSSGETGDDSSTGTNTVQKTEVEPRKSPREVSQQNSTNTNSTKDNRKAELKGKLEAKKLEICQKREQKIKSIQGRIAEHGTKQLDVFNKISERTQAFYKEKGNTVSNYDVLLTEVTAKKSAAETAIADVKSKSVEFKCDGDNPKAAAQSFKDSRKNAEAAMKAYKTAIKNLIVAVKSAQAQTQPPTTNNLQEEGQ